MTKKQNRTRGFGARLISVLLAILLVLSTMVVMLTATSLSTGAVGNHWVVAGGFGGSNDWVPNNSNTAFWINGSSGGNTGEITISDINNIGGKSSVTFKLVYVKSDGSYDWYGGNPTQINGSLKSKLVSGGGEETNINYTFTSGAKSLTFKVSYDNGYYISVTPNYESTNPTILPDDPDLDGTVGVNPNNSANRDGIFWVDATYYDYLSDKELSSAGGWLYPEHVGTSTFGGYGAIDEWYPFNRFNKEKISSFNSSWATPLYFGNFCDTYNAYDTPHHQNYSGQSGFTDATNGLARFNYAANNSNGVYDRFTSYQGLMADHLGSNGELLTRDGGTCLLFDEASLGNYAKVVKSAFPFRVSNNDGYTRYDFNSNGAQDNVYFTWKTEGNSTTPQYVNYGATDKYGVEDGYYDFMGSGSNGYGIFPFNNKDSEFKGTKTYTNENLDYGFGIRMDMRFRVPQDRAVSFDFTGDDDLWMYVTDEEGYSQLVLDMGGSHKKSEGNVTFDPSTGKITPTVNKVNGTQSNKDLWIVEYSNWGDLHLWGWGSGSDGKWIDADPELKENNQYRFTEQQLQGIDNFIVTSTKDWNTAQKAMNGSNDTFSVSAYAGKRVWTNNMGSPVALPHDIKKNQASPSVSYDFDPSKTYTMTVFYMERGLIESNCEMSFTMVPLGNRYTVTETIDTTEVNAGLRDAVEELSEFGFRTHLNGNTNAYDSFTLADGESNNKENIFATGDYLQMEQYATKDSYLVYDSSYTYTDNLDSDENNPLDQLTGGTTSMSGDQRTYTSYQKLINPSGDKFDYAWLQVDYVNKPKVTDVTISKKVLDSSSGNSHENDTYEATVALQLAPNTNPVVFDKLEIEDEDVEPDATDGKKYAYRGKITLRDGKTITIPNVPIGTLVTVTETNNPEYTQVYDTVSCKMTQLISSNIQDGSKWLTNGAVDSFGDYLVQAGSPVYGTVTEQGYKTVYFVDSYGWDTVYAFTTSGNPAWPGTLMSDTGTTDGGDPVYSVKLPANTQGIIFNNGGGENTIEAGDPEIGDAIDIPIVNISVDAPPADGEVQGKKYLNMSTDMAPTPYTGEMFYFTLKGMEPLADGDVDTSSVEESTYSVQNGDFSIPVSFDSPGVYRYRLYEDFDMMDGDYQNDIDVDMSAGIEYLVVFNVTKTGSQLNVDGPHYFWFSQYEDMIVGDDFTGDPVPNELDIGDFNADHELGEDGVPEFVNYVKTGWIRIEKTDQYFQLRHGDVDEPSETDETTAETEATDATEDPSKGLVNDVVFTVFKVAEGFEENSTKKIFGETELNTQLPGNLDDLTESPEKKSFSELDYQQKYDMVLKYLDYVRSGITGPTGDYEDGVTEIHNLPIYVEDFDPENPAYQKYVLIEENYIGSADYNINKTLQFFEFPASFNGQYHGTYTFVNGFLRNPEAAGIGMKLFKLIGVCVAGLSVLALAGYVIYTKKNAKRKTGKHFAE